jgi:CRP/FNR family cyclic AMP-dependent transcriptional regulator
MSTVGSENPRAEVGAQGFDWTGVRARRTEYPSGARIFEQGEPCRAILFIEAGTVRLSVISRDGKEAVVGVLDVGHFFGEGCLAGQTTRICSATAMSDCRLLVIETEEMRRQIHTNPALAQRFLAHMLTRNARVEQDLIDQLFNSSEKRLARTLLLLAHYGDETPSTHAVPKVSQELLAEMVGTTRSRVNFFMNRFRRLGFIEYNGKLKINGSLLSVLLHDSPNEMAPALALTSRGRVATATTRSRTTGKRPSARRAR